MQYFCLFRLWIIHLHRQTQNSMKKFSAFTLSILTAAVLSSTALASGPDETEIELQKINPTTRSLMDMPEASIYKDILSVSFDASSTCSFYIEDSFGATVYAGAFPADGMEYSYDLRSIGEGLFRLVIDGPTGMYEGYFSK